MEFEDFYEIYFKKICEYVNADYDKIDFYNDCWYDKYKWSNKDEIDCENWLFNLIINDVDLKKLLFNKKRITKKDVKKFVEHFVFDYGWKSSDNENVYIKKIKHITKK
jgi:hypothetical protein